MQRAWEQLQNRSVMLLAVDVGEDEDRVFEFTANYPVEFPLLLDEQSQVIGTWPVKGLPTTPTWSVLKSSGVSCHRWQGMG